MTRIPPLYTLLLGTIVGCSPATGPQEDTGPKAPTEWALPFAHLLEGRVGRVSVDEGSHARVFGSDSQTGGASWKLTAQTLCRDDIDSQLDAQSTTQFNDTWATGGVSGQLLYSGSMGIERRDIPTAEDLVGVWLGGAETWAITTTPDQAVGNLWRRPYSASWELMAIDLEGPFYGAWGRWFFGEGTAIYWDGVTLNEVPPPPGAVLYAAHGRQVPTTWFAGGHDTPQLFRWDSSGWLTVEVPQRCGHGGLRAVWEDPEGVVWLGGEHGTAARWDGTEWSCNDQPLPSTTYTAVMGMDPQVIWIGGRVEGDGDASGLFSSYPYRDVLTEVLDCSP